jgi:uncharacterized membrane protein YkvA (DUF1232 family)
MLFIKPVIRMFLFAKHVGGVRGAVRATGSLPKYALLFRRLFADIRVPVWAKLMVVAAIAFAFSPLNLPEYIPVLGPLDDIGIILFAGNLFFKWVPPNILAEHRRQVGLEPIPLKA